MTSAFVRLKRVSVLLVPMLLASTLAQGQAAPASVGGPGNSRVDLYLGYAYIRTYASDINNRYYAKLPSAAVGSVSGYFNKYVGLQLEGSFVRNSTDPSSPDNDCEYSAEAGPVVRLPLGRFVPYFHALGGAAQQGGPVNQTCSVWGWGLTGGPGADIILPIFNNRLALRGQFDATYNHIDNGPLILPAGVQGGVGKITALRPSGGLVFRFGDLQGTVAPTMACSVSPSEVFAGEPMTVSSTTMNAGNGKSQHYVWSTSAGPITAHDNGATIDTSKMEPGKYTATGALVAGKKDQQLATCAADFRILDFEPPTISCSADRSTIKSGDSVVISSVARSPQNLGITYSYSASSGQIFGNGETVNLTTQGVAPGAITVTCRVVDAKGKMAEATTAIVVATPPAPPPAPEARSLCGVSFDRDKARPDRVDNEAKGCLDDIALTMNRESSSRLLIIGNHAPGESAQHAGARALNESDYLVKEKGIDAARIDVRIGEEPTRTVTNTLVPPGAVLDAGTASAFDSSSIRRTGQPYGRPAVSTPKRRNSAQ